MAKHVNSIFICVFLSRKISGKERKTNIIFGAPKPVKAKLCSKITLLLKLLVQYNE